MPARIAIDREQIAAFCQRHQIRKLALFGSVLRDDFHAGSDVDVLVEYEPEAGVGLMSLAKVIVVVDEWIDVHNVQEAWWYALGNIDPERDVKFTKGPVDDLDHASQIPSFGSKMGIDGTKKWAAEGFTRRWPDMIEMDADIKATVDKLWPRLGIKSID